jgi:hypothetical protein
LEDRTLLASDELIVAGIDSGYLLSAINMERYGDHYGLSQFKSSGELIYSFPLSVPVLLFDGYARFYDGWGGVPSRSDIVAHWSIGRSGWRNLGFVSNSGYVHWSNDNSPGSALDGNSINFVQLRFQFNKRNNSDPRLLASGFRSRVFGFGTLQTNSSPTLDALPDVTVSNAVDSISVPLLDITAGVSESQELGVTAVSSNTGVIPHPAVTYTSPESSGSLVLSPQEGAIAKTTITVSVEDGGLDGFLGTHPDNAVTSRTFEVTLEEQNDRPAFNVLSDVRIQQGATEQQRNLTGISAGGNDSQPLRVTASSHVHVGSSDGQHRIHSGDGSKRHGHHNGDRGRRGSGQ